MIEPEAENFLKHRLAGLMPAGIPTGCQAEDHGFKERKLPELEIQRAFGDSAVESSDIVRRASAGTGGLAAFLLAGLLEVSVGTDILHDAFLIHDFLQAPQSFVNGFAASNFDLSHV
jgi:hypothetical protein